MSNNVREGARTGTSVSFGPDRSRDLSATLLPYTLAVRVSAGITRQQLDSQFLEEAFEAIV